MMRLINPLTLLAAGSGNVAMMVSASFSSSSRTRSLDEELLEEEYMQQYIPATNFSYGTSYLIFISLVVILTACFAFHWSTLIRQHDIMRNASPPSNASLGQHICNVINILALAACTAFLTWSSVRAPLKATLLLDDEENDRRTYIDDDYHDYYLRNEGATSTPTTSTSTTTDWWFVLLGEGRMGFLVANVALWIPLISVSKHYLNMHTARGLLLLVSTLDLAIPGMVILAFFAKQMEELQGYQYLGPMRITGVDVVTMQESFGRAMQTRPSTTTSSSSTSVTNNQRSSPKKRLEYFQGAVHVSWGGDWGCPDMPEDTWCDSLVYRTHCSYCHDDEFSFTFPNVTAASSSSATGNFGDGSESNESGSRGGSASSSSGTCQEKGKIVGSDYDAAQCITAEYNLGAWSNKIILDEENYERSIPPNQDVDWPAAVFYGDCTTCQARTTGSYDIQQEYVMKLRPVGFYLTCLGAILYASYYLCLWLPHVIQKTRSVVAASRQGSSSGSGSQASSSSTLEENELTSQEA